MIPVPAAAACGITPFKSMAAAWAASCSGGFAESEELSSVCSSSDIFPDLSCAVSSELSSVFPVVSSLSSAVPSPDSGCISVLSELSAASSVLISGFSMLSVLWSAFASSSAALLSLPEFLSGTKSLTLATSVSMPSFNPVCSL